MKTKMLLSDGMILTQDGEKTMPLKCDGYFSEGGCDYQLGRGETAYIRKVARMENALKKIGVAPIFEDDMFVITRTSNITGYRMIRYLYVNADNEFAFSDGTNDLEYSTRLSDVMQYVRKWVGSQFIRK